MEINSDFDERAVVHAAAMDWVPSPTAGVERKMLDRIGDELARATSIVRYAPDSRFPAHTHGGGEEFYVLEGVFQDEQGNYSAGSYVRNPPTSRHAPGSEAGCVIFVKLWQFDPDDRTHVVCHADDIPAHADANRPGVSVKPFYQDATENVRLEIWRPGTGIEIDRHGGLELLVLEGTCIVGDERFDRLSWLRLPPHESLVARVTDAECTVWLKTGHLDDRNKLESGLPNVSS